MRGCSLSGPAARTLALLTALAVVGCADEGASETAGAAAVRLEPVFGGLTFEEPVAMIEAPHEPGRWYVVEQRGVVRTFREAAPADSVTTFVDIRDRVHDGPNEAGLLGMALHPEFAANGEVYLSYTAATAAQPLVSRLSRFRSRDDGRSLDARSETILLTVEQPYGNHNGGQVAFGPDGYLYMGLGDGGAGGDPKGNGQDTGTLLGAMLRLDVDAGQPYAMPPDNPFADGGGRPEIFAWGLRNPWRWSFDRETGELWAGDVGQNRWEEIDVVRRGGNYGWNIREGAHCYGESPCRTEGLIDPVVEYGHGQGCSVTGGYVYRGKRISGLGGTYVYGDYCSGRIWGAPSGDPGGGSARLLLETDLSIASFGEGLDGELYVIDHDGGGIYRLRSVDAR